MLWLSTKFDKPESLIHAFICDYFPFVLITCYRFSFLSQFWRCHFEYLSVIQPSMMTGRGYSLVCLCVHSHHSYSHSNAQATFRCLGLGLKVAMQWTPALRYRIPLFTLEIKLKCTNLRISWVFSPQGAQIGWSTYCCLVQMERSIPTIPLLLLQFCECVVV